MRICYGILVGGSWLEDLVMMNLVRGFWLRILL